MKVRSIAFAALLAFAAPVLPAMSRAAVPQQQRAAAVLVADMAMSSGSETTQDAGPFRILLAVLPAEPFLTAAQAKRGVPGMLAVSGASPVAPSAPSHPNHHLVIHVYDRTNGRVLRGAHVTMSFTRIAHGSMRDAPVSVPVVEMQAAGKGAQSTHYGNNVFMRAGTYRIAVTINGAARSAFIVRVV